MNMNPLLRSTWTVQFAPMAKGPVMRAVEMIERRYCTSLWRFESEELLKPLVIPVRWISSLENNAGKAHIWGKACYVY